uniref:Uncharacterized protein n=1 Tax=Chondria tumulosa TaxID=2740715 RepID=A0A896SSV0_9FLOR|nr:hypothetical protein K8K75_pgp194 [Chondria tumulosa]QSD57013.1 hypothetical protein [Chondria tumulosa]
MNNNTVLFRLYVIFILCFLIPMSFVVSLQIYSLFKDFFAIYFLYNFTIRSSKLLLDYHYYNKLFDLFLERQQFSLCISSAELFASIFLVNIDLVYTLLAFCYQKNSFFYIAEYYYLKALSFSPTSIVILSSLAKIYSKTGNYNQLKYINNKISQLN